MPNGALLYSVSQYDLSGKQEQLFKVVEYFETVKENKQDEKKYDGSVLIHSKLDNGTYKLSVPVENHNDENNIFVYLRTDSLPYSRWKLEKVR